MKRTVIFACALVGLVSVSPSMALSQDSTFAAIEGHVFNAKTRQPLANVYASYTATTGGVGGGVSMVTNENGFYELEVQPSLQSGDTITFAVVCQTRRGNVQMFGKLYETLRTEIYRRDFYLTLPRGVSRCNP